MEKKLKVLLDAELTDDKINLELQNGSGSSKIMYTYQACGGGGGGCGGGGCGGCGGGCGGCNRVPQN